MPPPLDPLRRDDIARARRTPIEERARQALESALGVQLFVRTTRTVQLTDEGRALHQRTATTVTEERARHLTEKPAAQQRIVSNDMLFVREVARRDAGLVALPVFLGAPDVEAGLLARVLPSWRGPRAQIYLVRPSDRNLPRRAALFRDALVEALRERPAAARRSGA